METYTTTKAFVDNPAFFDQRQTALLELGVSKIDAPIAQLISDFSRMSCCFTLQSCYGHFLYPTQRNPHNVVPLPHDSKIIDIEYRIAYLAFCIQNSDPGIKLLHDLQNLAAIDPEYIQFGCAEWFWKRQVNSYILQIEPERFSKQDSAIIDYHEALHIEQVRNEFFRQTQQIIQTKK